MEYVIWLCIFCLFSDVGTILGLRGLMASSDILLKKKILLLIAIRQCWKRLCVFGLSIC